MNGVEAPVDSSDSPSWAVSVLWLERESAQISSIYSNLTRILLSTHLVDALHLVAEHCTDIRSPAEVDGSVVLDVLVVSLGAGCANDGEGLALR